MGIDEKDVPGTKIVEVQGDDGLTKWVAVGRQSDIQISPQLQEVVDGIPIDLPAEFGNQARQVAEWMTALDGGDRQLLENPKVQEWLGEILSLVGVLQTCEWACSDMVPWWLNNKNEVVMKFVDMVLGQNEEEILTNDEELVARDNWIKWGGKTGKWVKGGYYVGDQLVGEAHECDGFKLYINGKNISRSLEDGRWDEAYRDLEVS